MASVNPSFCLMASSKFELYPPPIFFIIYLISFDLESHVALAVLELVMYPRLALNSQRSACLCLLSAGVKVMHNIWLNEIFCLLSLYFFVILRMLPEYF